MLELNKIYNEDCVQGMRKIDEGSISLILTDPPYEISRKSNYASSAPTGRDTDRFRISIDFGSWDAKKAFDIGAMIKESYRCLKKGGYIVCFYDLWKIETLKSIMEEAGFKQIRFIEWVKTNPVPINSKVNYLTNAREVAVCAVKGIVILALIANTTMGYTHSLSLIQRIGFIRRKSRWNFFAPSFRSTQRKMIPSSTVVWEAEQRG